MRARGPIIIAAANGGARWRKATCPYSLPAAASAAWRLRWRSRERAARPVLESAADFREVGAGIQLGPNVFRMFELLGLTEAINACAVFPTT